MTPIKRNISYQFKDRWLRMQVRWNARRVLLWVGFEVDRQDAKGRLKWDGQRCRLNTAHGPSKIPAAVINKELDRLESLVNDYFMMCEMEDRAPSPEELKAAVSPDSKKSAPTVEEAFLKFVAHGEARKGWAFNTVKSVMAVKEIISRYRPRLTFREITPELLDGLVEFMAANRLSPNNFKTGQKGYSNATIIKHCRTIRWFLAWASQKDLLPESAWKGFSPDVKTVRQPVVFLEWEELMRLESAELAPGSEEERARDFFLFCCFTGLRYSDAAALRKAAVRGAYFEVVAIKTGTPLRIELNDHSARILAKYAAQPGSLALPSVTNNRLNHLLKEIGKSIGIEATVISSQYYGSRRIDRTDRKWQRLSSHCARRTFICNAIYLGIPIHIVMKWTGHTEVASLRPYLEIVNRQKEAEMSKFNLRH